MIIRGREGGREREFGVKTIPWDERDLDVPWP
jgi:hypothetical protein